MELIGCIGLIGSKGKLGSLGLWAEGLSGLCWAWPGLALSSHIWGGGGVRLESGI